MCPPLGLQRFPIEVAAGDRVVEIAADDSPGKKPAAGNGRPAPSRPGCSPPCSSHRGEACVRRCCWNETAMCVQWLLPRQVLVERRLSLGVLHGLKQVYYPDSLPPCITGQVIDWSRPQEANVERSTGIRQAVPASQCAGPYALGTPVMPPPICA